jgi:hypothetical protein
MVVIIVTFWDLIDLITLNNNFIEHTVELDIVVSQTGTRRF